MASERCACGCHDPVHGFKGCSCCIPAPSSGAILTREEYERHAQRVMDDDGYHAESKDSLDKILAHDAALRARADAAEEALASARAWRKCETHGQIDGAAQWGCPECVRTLRAERDRLREALQASNDAVKQVRAHWVGTTDWLEPIIATSDAALALEEK